MFPLKPVYQAYHSALKCPRCGSASIIFDEDTSSLVCANCGYVIQQGVVSYAIPFSRSHDSKQGPSITEPEAIDKAVDLVSTGWPKKHVVGRTVDKVDVIASNIMSEINLISLIYITGRTHDIVKNIAYRISRILIDEIGDYTKLARANMSACLAEAILSAMRIPYEGTGCDIDRLRGKYLNAVSSVIRTIRKLASPINVLKFRSALVEKGIIMHPGDVVMFPNQRAFDVFDRLTSSYEIKRLRCLINKFRVIRSFALPAGLRSMKCGNFIDRNMAKDYVMTVVEHFGSEFSLMAMASAFDYAHNTTRIIVPKDIYDIIEQFTANAREPDIWIATDFSCTRHCFNFFSTVNDLGYLVSDFNILINGMKVEDIVAEAERSGNYRMLDVPVMPSALVASHNAYVTVNRSINYIKILIGGAVLLRRFLRRAYPNIASAVPFLDAFVGGLKEMCLSIRVPKGRERYAEIIRRITSSKPKKTVFKYYYVRKYGASRAFVPLP